MGDVIKMPNTGAESTEKVDENVLTEVANEFLSDARAEISGGNTYSVPLERLNMLGVAVAALIPPIEVVTKTAATDTTGLYQLANMAVGDTLKVAKNGNFLGAFKTPEGQSKFLQIKPADPLKTTTTSVAPINPATMMMAVALFSIEQKLADIENMQRQIMSFLEIEKDSEVEADVEMLTDMMKKYKLNWDNEYFVSSNHKLVLDIQRTARKNMSVYQKQVEELLHAKKFVVVQNHVNAMLRDLQKKFKYYRLSLYTFSLASMLEIMLSGNFKEEYISGIKEEVEGLSKVYRDLFGECSIYLEKISGVSLEANVLKGLGAASGAVGKFIGSIPLVKEGKVDEFLQDSGNQIKSNAQEIEMSSVLAFAEISNPGTNVLIDKMEDLIQIYNRTKKIYFDDEKIYVLAG